MKERRGFTLIELLATMAIVALVVTVAASALRGARHQARVAECAHNLRQVWSALSVYAQDHYALLPAGKKTPNRLPPETAETLRELLDGQVELLYCRTYPLRAQYLDEWRGAIAEGNSTHTARIGYVYLAGSRFDCWDVPDERLPDGFDGAPVDDVGQGLAYSADVVWLADVARCTTASASDRLKPYNWDLTSHPPQRVRQVPEKIGREDYCLPDGANVVFEDGHVVFRPFGQLRPRVIKSSRLYYW